MPVSFPDVTLNIVPGVELATSEEQRILVVGQMLSGTATSGELVQNIADTDTAINALFGQRSHIANMIRKVKDVNRNTRVDAIPLDDGGSATQATATIALSGTATAAGRYYVTLVSRTNHRVAVDIASGDTANSAATKINAAITGATNYGDAPFTSAVATNTVTATAANGGTLANTWHVEVESTVPGLSVTVTGWTGGATDPSVTNVLDVTGSQRYQTVVWPEVYDLSVVRAWIDDRFNVTNGIENGTVISNRVDTMANIVSEANGLNSQNIVILSDQIVNAPARKGSMLREMPDVTTALVGGIRSLRLTADSNVTQFVTTTEPRDQFGGDHFATLPYANTQVTGIQPPLPEDDWSADEMDDLEEAGASVVTANRTYTNVIMGEFVTTYKTDSAGNPDTSYKFLNTVDAVSVTRERFVLNLRRRYAQTRLTSGELIPQLAMANESSIFGFLTQVRADLVDDGILQAGEEAEADFERTTTVSITSLSQGRVSVAMAPLLVGQLRALIGTITVNFGSNV